jgi:LEA14-like dessication related protein
MLRFVIALSVVVGFATGCHTQKSPELRVLGIHDAPATQRNVFVQVTNPARRPMRLTKLEYTFASAQSGAKVSEGELDLSREIPAGSAVVVEVPLEAESTTPLTLRGKLTAELDQIVRIFKVDAQIQPH